MQLFFHRRGDFENAESLIDEMTQLSEEGRMDLRPTIHSYAALVCYDMTFSDCSLILETINLFTRVMFSV